MGSATHLWIVAALYLAGASLAETAADRPQLPQPGPDNSSLYRLPKSLLPESYELLLLTNVSRANFAYEAEVGIRLLVAEATDRVVLHAYKETLALLAEKSRLTRLSSGADADASSIHQRDELITHQRYDHETQFYVLQLAEKLLPGNKYLLRLFFVGQVADDVFGFYRSSYRTADAEIRWIGVTQFSTTFARRAFPCLDEPGFKATFQLRIGHYKNETVTSNTLAESTTHYRGYEGLKDYYITRFAKTPRMSTYLVGWAIHDFDRINSSDPLFSLSTRSARQAPWHRAPALVEGPRLYSTLERWMDLPNPIRKVELFAVPDFHFAAMENWGLVTFRESVPLVTYESTASKVIHGSLKTMGHEFAHTWFGNIVTMDFWDHAWLKEGFATYFAYLGLAMLDREPRLVMEDLFTLENVHASMLSDSVKHNRTMNGRGVGSPKSCNAAMDFVTYEKGASVIRMFAEVVGADVFKVAMRSYLRDKQYEAAVPSDVYEHLELARKMQPIHQRRFIPVSIDEFIDSWANQTNYPLDDLKESRFWWIPVNVTTGNNVIQNWLGPESTRHVQLPPKTEWYLVNHRQIGYYRVDYDQANWLALQKVLRSENFRQIGSVDRAGLLDDAFNLARAGFRDYELPLELALYLRRENDYAPWVAACRGFLLIDDNLRNKPVVRTAFRRYIGELIAPIYKKLSFEVLPNDSRVRKMQRTLVLSTACTIDLPDCVSSAKSIFDHWISYENKDIAADLKALVYRVGIVNGSSEHWISLRQRFFKAELRSEKEPMIYALASSENPTFIKELLELAIQPDSDVAKQYRLSIIRSIITGNSRNIDTTLNYLQNNVTNIIRLRGDEFLADILSEIGTEINSIEQIDKMTQFITANASLLGRALEAGKKAIESARNNITWINTCITQVSNYLNKFRHS